MRKGEVYVNDILAGTITEDTTQGYIFIYADEYFKNPSMPAISLTMPKKQQVYISQYLFPFFANMLSEGSNRIVQAKLHRVDIEDDFGILLATASVDTPGAVIVKRIDYD